jgi:hypothetical protein
MTMGLLAPLTPQHLRMKVTKPNGKYVENNARLAEAEALIARHATYHPI